MQDGQVDTFAEAPRQLSRAEKEAEMLRRARAGQMKTLADTFGLDKADLSRIEYANSDDPIFPYHGSPYAQAQMIADEKAASARPSRFWRIVEAIGSGFVYVPRHQSLGASAIGGFRAGN